MNNRKLFNDKDELESSMINYLNLQKEKQNSLVDQNKDIKSDNFQNETLKVNVKDYYFSNVIA
jgi:NADH-quinone oxidoreductase subunit G